MAFSAHKTAEAMQELVDDEATFLKNVQQVAALIRDSPHTVFYTGAGISTSAGIPDYRGPQGVWTLAAEGKKRTAPTTDMMRAIPTPTHMAIVQLVRIGKAQHIISQNVDGLHRKSGILPSQISELHGNSNIEVCSSCGRQYLRDYHVSSVARDHSTGQLCEMPGCGGVLKDNIINFHENLDTEILNRAFKESQAARLHICLGSSLTVKPANELPRCTKECGGQVVIVNLQRTPLDNIADVRVHSPVDKFLTAVMAALSIPIPSFELERRIVLWHEDGTLKVSGVEDDGMPSSLLSSITVEKNGTVVKGPALPLVVKSFTGSEDAVVRCSFFGHYGEPEVSLILPKGARVAAYALTLNPLADDAWRVAKKEFSPPNFTPVVKRPAVAGPRAPQISQAPPISDFTGYHAVSPIADCPHTKECSGFRANQVIDLQAPCSVCGNVGENMVCLTCGIISCGRHVAGHMLQHHDATSHPLVAAFTDLSFWCYKCESYLLQSNPRLRQYYGAMHLAKFGHMPGQAPPEESEPAPAPPPPAPHRPQASDFAGYHAVTPLDDCPHTTTVSGFRANQVIDLQAPCSECGNIGENMVCLTCGLISCGRHVSGHMEQHHDHTGHPMVCGMIDISFWCYKCDSYINESNPRLRQYFAALHLAKFGTLPFA
jgi:mono-ADP-ribosyltransferase sirtuin 6